MFGFTRQGSEVNSAAGTQVNTNLTDTSLPPLPPKMYISYFCLCGRDFLLLPVWSNAKEPSRHYYIFFFPFIPLPASGLALSQLGPFTCRILIVHQNKNTFSHEIQFYLAVYTKIIAFLCTVGDQIL